MHAVTIQIAFTVLANALFNVESTCPAPSPCRCRNGEILGIIDCSGKSLPTIPYMVYQREINYHTLDYSKNQLTTIGPSVFANLNITRLLLNHNNISDITQAAFNGIEGTLRDLNLSDNNLKQLPASLGYFRSLTTLDVSYNPLDGERRGLRPREIIDDFTDGVMRELGDTLTALTFGDSNTLSHWPKSINHAIHLESLHLIGSKINYIRTGWFRGFEDTLTMLSISDYDLVQVPVDLEDLTQLSELHIDNNRNEDGDSIFIEAPFIGIADTLVTLTLKYDYLTTFPDVIQHLTKLRNLSLEGNDLVYVSEESIGYMQNMNLTYLSLKRCALKRIPGAISDLKRLIELDLSGNVIKTIEAPDLTRMPALLTLVLSSNPLKYMSRSALRRLSSLTSLDMSNSELTELPACIQNLRNIHMIDLTNGRIDCTCQMYWIKRWMVLFRKHVTFLGDCETIRESLDRYVNYRLPLCPRYLET